MGNLGFKNVIVHLIDHVDPSACAAAVLVAELTARLYSHLRDLAFYCQT
jgi:hypothetical protein